MEQSREFRNRFTFLSINDKDVKAFKQEMKGIFNK